MTDDSPQAGGQEEPTGPINPPEAGDAAPDDAAQAPRKRRFLSKKRAPRERAEPSQPTAERPKRGLLPRRKPKREDAPADDQPTTAFAPVEDGATPDGEVEPAKGRRRARRPPREKKQKPRRTRGDRPPPASALRRERRALLSSRQDAVYHLGGLAFELYRRDLLQDGVLRQRAVELAALDDRIREIDKNIGEQPARGRRGAGAAGVPAIAGNCMVCRAEFAPEARFCSSCGARFAPESAESEQVTGVIDLPPES